MLGNTLEAIAGEKAGIIKSAKPVVLGAGCREVYKVFEEKAHLTNSSLIKAPSSTAFDSLFKAAYQKENFACALEALKLLPYSVEKESIKGGIQNVAQNSGYFGRLQIVQEQPTIIYDVAHNPDGIKSTFAAISKELTGELYLIYGSSKDKDVKKIISVLPENIHVLATEFTNSRSLKRVDLQAAFSGTNFKSTAYYDNALTALEQAKERAKPDDTIVALGSFFLLSDFF
jgi:dihydrofolate synthase/folylpolyglutamate synthase